MKYHRVSLKKKGKKLVLYYEKDIREEENYFPTPNLFFYEYPETMSDAEAGQTFIDALISFRHNWIESAVQDIIQFRAIDVPTL